MPLYKSSQINESTHLLVWKITESAEELSADVVLKHVCENRVIKMKSELHRRAFLSVRKLMQEIGYTDHDMYYGEDGKPHLVDGKNISITHSFGFSAIIVSDRGVGIDIEIRREKVIKIANKFVDREFEFLDPTNVAEYVRKLIVIWGVKEALYKMFSRQGLSFRQHIDVNPFNMGTGLGTATVNFEDIMGKYTFNFEEIEDFTLVYCVDRINMPQ